MDIKSFNSKTQNTVDNLRIIDDTLFRLISSRLDVCQEILRTLLDDSKLEVLQVIPQETVQSLHREITLDVLCRLGDGTLCNIEMQKGNWNDDLLRTRFHAAAITAKYTPKGTKFRVDDIPKVTILYITEYDALNNGRSVTHVSRCMDMGDGIHIPVNDGEDIIFANTKVKECTGKSELLQLFLRRDTFYHEKYPAMSAAMKYFKETEGGRAEVCRIVEEYARECAKEERLDAIRNMIELGVSKEKILTKYSVEDYEKAEKGLVLEV